MLSPGTRLGGYVIGSTLGAGGMGEVYRATDTRLGRDVAIKVLPDAFAVDADRIARIEREARALAALNHPNVALIYGLEDAGGARALVLELVEGPTLADRLARGPLPLDEALGIANQIAGALDAAHSKNIIHRDLKPANIKVRDDGTVKVLDFGLAKALDAASGAGGDDQLNSPTITSPAETERGVILGTAAYMSPEQARGKSVDRRADIWAFACVLYEMLTGKPPFGGEGVADTLGAVLHKEPDWDRLDPAIPARIRMVLQRCLRKDPRQRLHDIADVSLVLGGAFETPAQSSGAESGQPVSPARSRGTTLAAVAGLAIGGLITGAVMWTWRAAPSSTAPVRVVLTTPDDLSLRHGVGPDLAITPDGTRVIYQADAAGGGLASRALNQLQPAMLQGTSASEQPFVSPDGAWVGYRDEKDGAIKKISIEGGPAITLTPPLFGFQGASWGDGVIVFASARSGGLFRVPDTGGEPERVTSADEKRGEVGHAWPHLLPGSHAVLFTREIRNQGTLRSETVLLDLRTREQRVLIPEGSGARYVATGHLVYAVGDTLRAVGFDLATQHVRGSPVPVLDGVMSTAQAAPNFSVSSNGSLVYVRSPATTWTGRPVWVSRDGREESARITEDVIAPQYPRLSPDGRRVALIVAGDVWVYDLSGALPIRLTSGARYASPIWTADGRRLVMEGTSPLRLWVIATDGSEQQPQPASALGHFHPLAWSDDGRGVLAVQFVDGLSNIDIVRWQPGKPDEREPVVQTAAQDGFKGASLSPDGRWLAHTSDQSGRTEVWVRPYPGPGVPVRVSTNGGIEPVWSRTGHELYYLEGQRVMAVAVSTGSTFGFKSPTWLFDSRYRIFGQPWSYDVAADGRFLMIRPTTEAQTSPQVVVVLNWHEELKRLVPLR